MKGKCIGVGARSPPLRSPPTWLRRRTTACRARDGNGWPSSGCSQSFLQYHSVIASRRRGRHRDPRARQTRASGADRGATLRDDDAPRAVSAHGLWRPRAGHRTRHTRCVTWASRRWPDDLRAAVEQGLRLCTIYTVKTWCCRALRMYLLGCAAQIRRNLPAAAEAQARSIRYRPVPIRCRPGPMTFRREFSARDG